MKSVGNHKVKSENEKQNINIKPETEPVMSTTINSGWPSVTSLKSVFNKSCEIDIDQEQPRRKSRTYGNQEGSKDNGDEFNISSKTLTVIGENILGKKTENDFTDISQYNNDLLVSQKSNVNRRGSYNVKDLSQYRNESPVSQQSNVNRRGSYNVKDLSQYRNESPVPQQSNANRRGSYNVKETNVSQYRNESPVHQQSSISRRRSDTVEQINLSQYRNESPVNQQSNISRRGSNTVKETNLSQYRNESPVRQQSSISRRRSDTVEQINLSQYNNESLVGQHIPDINRRGSSTMKDTNSSTAAEIINSSKNTTKNDPNILPVQTEYEESPFWKIRLKSVNRRGSIKKFNETTAVEVTPTSDVTITEIGNPNVHLPSHGNKDPPAPKNRSYKMDTSSVKNNEITAAALKVASAYGKNVEHGSAFDLLSADKYVNVSNMKEQPIPKSRKSGGSQISSSNSDVHSISADITNKKKDEKEKTYQPVIISKINEIPARQIRTKENRLGVYSKDVPANPTDASNFTKPIASVQPTEIIPSPEIIISANVEKWPPVSIMHASIIDDKSNRIQNGDEEISSKFDSNNNDINRTSSILSENNKNIKKTLRDNDTPQHMDTFASILVIGLASSGKSSMIDELLDQQVPRMSKGEIIEHTLHIKIPESNESFYNIRIIDTPGFKNEKVGNSFARMFATLLQYCRSREGLRGKYPNIVLFVISFDEKFQENENCDLINFLKVIHHFETYFKNPKFLNFIFVLTHLTNAVRHEQVYPELKILEFINLIKKYTTLNGTIKIICAENQGEAVGLKVADGFYKLPNGDMYPSNLIDEMKMILTRKGHISLSETIIRTAFGPEYPNCIKHFNSKIISQIKEDSPSIPQMKQTLKEIYLQIKIEKTEISSLLQVGWENINPNLQKMYTSSLLTSQRIFQLHKIKNFNDLPTETTQIFKLLRELPQNLAVADLLIHTLQLKIPHNIQALFIGQGYDLSQDRGTNMSPLQFSNILKTSPIGQIPNELHCHVIDDRAIIFKFFYTPEDYVLDRMKELGIRYASFPGNLPMPTLKRPGYNIIKENQEPTKTTTATALIEYRSFRLTLEEIIDKSFEFKTVFWDALESQPQIDSKIIETIQVWKEFFNCWGTHLIKSAYGGGSIEINFKGKMLSKLFSSLNQPDTIPSDEDMTNRIFQWITGDGLDFFAATTEIKSDFLKGLNVQTNIQGGDDKFNDIDFTKLQYDQVTEIRNEWKDSLFLRPIILETNLVLIPISYFVRQKCEVTALKMDMAFHYIYSQFITQGEVKNSSCTLL